MDMQDSSKLVWLYLREASRQSELRESGLLEALAETLVQLGYGPFPEQHIDSMYKNAAAQHSAIRISRDDLYRRGAGDLLKWQGA